MTEPNARFQAFLEAVGRAPIIPVLTIERPVQAGPLARALAAGGIAAIEITLRRPGAVEAIAAAAEAAPDLLVGAGTVLDQNQLDSAAAAGARFAVSPGATPALLEAARGWDQPFLPGVASASETHGRAGPGLPPAQVLPRRAARRAGGAQGPWPHPSRRSASVRPAASPATRRRTTCGSAACSAWAAPGSPRTS